MIKRIVAVFSTLFVITLAIIFGLRVSADALGVIIGVILGIMASVPTTLLLVFILARQHKAERPPYGLPQQPPVIIVNGPDKPAGYTSPPALPIPYQTNGHRRWTVIGDEEPEP